MAKVLWMGDAGCHTGFATVTHAIGERLVAKGHDVHVLAYNFKGDYWPTSLKLYRPNTLDLSDQLGRSRIVEMLGKVEPDVVVMLNDPHILMWLLYGNTYDKEFWLLKYRPILTYIPVDGYNMPPVWTETLSKYTNVIAMSRFGQDSFPNAQMVYHGVDSAKFYPVSPGHPITLSNGTVCTTKQECKQAFGYDPDGFLILRVDKNSGRKDFGATWKALLPIVQRHSDVQVHLHTAAKAETGVDIDALTSRDEPTMKRFYTPGLHNSFIGWEQSDLLALYNAADLFVSTSRGEGFGLTLAESLAAGVPVVAQNVSAIPEVVGPGGVLIDPERMITVPHAVDHWLSDIPAFTEAVEGLYLDSTRREQLGKAGREHVAESFSWDAAADRFHEYVEAMASATGT